MSAEPSRSQRSRPSTTVRTFRLYAALVFAFAWVPVMFTAFTRDRGFSAEQYLRLWSAYYLAMVVSELPWGRVADRLGTRPLLVAGPLALAVSFLLLGHSASFGACWWAMVVCGCAHAMISGADSAYLYESLVAEGRRSDALREESLANRSRLVGVSAADLTGGLVAFSLGTAAAFDLSAVLMLAAAAAAWRLPSVRPPQEERPAPSLAVLGRALAGRGARWIVAWYVLLFVLVRIGFQLYQPTLLAVGAADLRLHGAVFSLLNLVAAAAAVFVARAHARFRERDTACLVLLLVVISFAGLSTLGTGLVTALFCLQQVSFGFLQPLGRTALNHRVPSSDRASALSAQSLLARLAFGALLGLGDWDGALDVDLGRTYGVLALVALGLALVLFVTYPADTDA